MCLVLRHKCKEPHNRNRRRWKLLKIRCYKYKINGRFIENLATVYLTSPFYANSVPVGRWHNLPKDEMPGQPRTRFDSNGFHVFVNREDAECHKQVSGEVTLVFPVTVRRFLRSGHSQNPMRYPQETWASYRISRATARRIVLRSRVIHPSVKHKLRLTFRNF